MGTNFERESSPDIGGFNLEAVKQRYEYDEEAGVAELVMLGRELLNVNGYYDEYLNGRMSLWKYFYKLEKLPFSVTGPIYAHFLYWKQEKKSISSDIFGDIRSRFTGNEKEEMSEVDLWMIKVMIEMIYKDFDYYKNDDSITYIANSVSMLLMESKEFNYSALPMALELMKSSNIKAKEGALSILHAGFETDETIMYMSEYFKDMKDCDTFFAGSVINELGSVTNKNRRYMRSWESWDNYLSDQTKEALGVFMGNLEKSLPEFYQRGHEKKLAKSLNLLLCDIPGMRKYLGKKSQRLVGRNKLISQGEGHGRVENLDSEFAYLKKLYEKLTPTQRGRLEKRLNDEGMGYKTNIVLHDFFTNNNSNTLDEDRYLSEEEIANIRECLSENRMVLEIMNLIAGREEFRFQMGALLSMMDFSSLPKKLKERIRTVDTDAEHTIKIMRKFWWLCEQSESRLADAMYNGAVLMVNDNLLLKFKGKLSALCLKTFTSKNGFTFLKGNWYCPVGDETRDIFLDAKSSGLTKINIAKSEWVLMRAVQEVGTNTGDDLIIEARRVSNILDKMTSLEFELEDD